MVELRPPSTSSAGTRGRPETEYKQIRGSVVGRQKVWTKEKGPSRSRVEYQRVIPRGRYTARYKIHDPYIQTLVLSDSRDTRTSSVRSTPSVCCLFIFDKSVSDLSLRPVRVAEYGD